jgi:sec-independent protein translocase protein TatB
MFDIGFSELLVIGIVALVVIGPEKLPRLARTLGHLAGRLQRYVSDVKSDISREMELEDLKKMRDSLQQTASSFETSVKSELNKTESDLNQAAQSLSAEAKAGAPDSKTAAPDPVPETKKPEEAKP